MIRKSTTHEVCIDPESGIVVKRFRSWSRSEPVREWTALTLLAESAPGLAPSPVHADLGGHPPTLTMSAWSDASLDADEFLSLFDLTHAEAARVHDYRRLAALFWLIMLRLGGTSSTRNPPSTLERQADRLLELLG